MTLLATRFQKFIKTTPSSKLLWLTLGDPFQQLLFAISATLLVVLKFHKLYTAKILYMLQNPLVIFFEDFKFLILLNVFFIFNGFLLRYFKKKNQPSYLYYLATMVYIFLGIVFVCIAISEHAYYLTTATVYSRHEVTTFYCNPMFTFTEYMLGEKSDSALVNSLCGILLVTAAFGSVLFYYLNTAVNFLSPKKAKSNLPKYNTKLSEPKQTSDHEKHKTLFFFPKDINFRIPYLNLKASFKAETGLTWFFRTLVILLTLSFIITLYLHRTQLTKDYKATSNEYLNDILIPNLQRSVLSFTLEVFWGAQCEQFNGAMLGGRYSKEFNSLKIDLGTFQDLDTGSISESQTVGTGFPAIPPLSKEKKPNVVVVILESTRFKEAVTLGKDVNPFFYNLTQKGILFDNFYSGGPYTNKALIALMCGRAPRMADGNYEIFTLSPQCLPTVMAEKGYTTLFTQAVSYDCDYMHDILFALNFSHLLSKEMLMQEHKRKWMLKAGTHDDNSMLEPAFEWIDKKLPSKDPFFHVYITYNTHTPYFVPSYHNRQQIPHEKSNSEGKYERYLQTLNFASETFLKNLTDEYRKRDLLNSTYFLFVGDHGQSFKEHGFNHNLHNPYNEAFHVPLLITGPGIKQGVIKEPHLSQDLLAIVMEVLGIDLVADLQLKDKDSVGADPTSSSPAHSTPDSENVPDSAPSFSFTDSVHIQQGGIYESQGTRFGRPIRCSVSWPPRTGAIACWDQPSGLKLIKWIETERLEIYNMTADPDEHSNLAKNKETLSYVKIKELSDYATRWYRHFST